MKSIVCSLAVFLLLAAFPPSGECLIRGEWDPVDSLSFIPRKVCVDNQDRKWFIAADGLWVFDNTGWTLHPIDVPYFAIASVNSMEAAKDGSIWIGTRFDGVLSFDGTAWQKFSASNSGIGSNKVKGIASDGAGGMWFATAKHAAFLKDDAWRIYPIGSLLPEGAELTCVDVDQRGGVWFGTNGYGVLRFDGSALQKYSEYSEVASGNITLIHAFPDGRLAVGGGTGVSIFEKDSWKTIPILEAIEYLEFDPSGNIWFGNTSALFCYDGENTAILPDIDSKLYGMVLDRANHLWFATDNGVYHSTGRFIQILQPKVLWLEGSPGIVTGTTLPVVWMANRVDRVALDYSLDRGNTWNSITTHLSAAARKFDWAITRDVLPPGYLTATACIRVSSLEDSTLFQTVNIRIEAKDYRNSMSKLTPDNSGLASGTVRAMVEDPDGVLWFATDKGVSRFDGSDWRTLTSGNSGLVSDDVHDCALGADGSLWFGTAAGISHYSGGNWKTWLTGNLTVKIKTGGNAVWAVCADSLNSLYHNPVNLVLYRLKGDSWIPFRTVDGDTLRNFSQFQVDRAGNAWLIRILPAPEFPTCNPPPDQFLRCDGDSWEKISMDDLNNHYRIQNFIFDERNILWGAVGPDGWVESFDTRTWANHGGPRNGFPGIDHYLAFGPENILWCASQYSISSYDGTQWTICRNDRGWPDREIGNIHGLLVDRNGVKWVLTSWGVFRFDDRLVPVEEEKEWPQGIAVTGNFPNPFNPSTTITFTLPSSCRADLAIYTITGQKIRQLISEHLPSGAHTVRWDGRDSSGKPVSSGIYFSRLEAGGRTATGKMALVR